MGRIGTQERVRKGEVKGRQWRRLKRLDGALQFAHGLPDCNWQCVGSLAFYSTIGRGGELQVEMGPASKVLHVSYLPT